MSTETHRCGSCLQGLHEECSERCGCHTFTRPCAHCGRLCGDYDGGYGGINGVQVCHPNAPDRPDCYSLVTVQKHQLRDCPKCTPKSTEVTPTPARKATPRLWLKPFGKTGAKATGWLVLGEEIVEWLSLTHERWAQVEAALAAAYLEATEGDDRG